MNWRGAYLPAEKDGDRGDERSYAVLMGSSAKQES